MIVLIWVGCNAVTKSSVSTLTAFLNWTALISDSLSCLRLAAKREKYELICCGAKNSSIENKRSFFASLAFLISLATSSLLSFFPDNCPCKNLLSRKDFCFSLNPTTFDFDFNAQPTSSKGEDVTKRRKGVWFGPLLDALHTTILPCLVRRFFATISHERQTYNVSPVKSNVQKILYTVFGTRKYLRHRSFSTILVSVGKRSQNRCWITQIWCFISCHGLHLPHKCHCLYASHELHFGRQGWSRQI